MRKVLTYSATVWGSTDDVVLKLEIRIEDFSVELDPAIQLIADFLPVGCGFTGHCFVVGACYESPQMGLRVGNKRKMMPEVQQDRLWPELSF